ncbi:MAG: type II toxin-antitoxin system VapC family toxin [Anaerolineae bacterium]|nr:type II toxin-antitoxin system VapC family toxin [Anaerolineae bacterium]
MNITIDASVFVSSARTNETHYHASRQFLIQVQDQDAILFCPSLVLPECAAAIARPTGDAALGEELVALIEAMPGLQLVHLDSSLAHRAAEIATRHRLRGADAVYVAVAEALDAILITLDAEMLERGAVVVTTMTPTQFLSP